MEMAPIEVALVVEPAFERPSETRRRGAGAAGARHVPRVGRQQAHAAVGDRRRTPRDLPWLIISGFGAHRLLAQEVGLHVLELADEDKGSRPGGGASAPRHRAAGRSPGRKSSAARSSEALGRGPQPHAVVRRYRSEPSPLVRNMNGSWRTGKLDAVLRGDFDLIAVSQG